MRLLAIETATDLVGVALAGEGGCESASMAVGRRMHAELLAPMVHEVCARAGAGLGDLDALAVDAGPGLFTGLRVGVALANGLGASLRLGVLGLSSLDVLALGAAEAGWRGEVAALVDARRQQVFLGRYEVGDDGRPRRLGVVARCQPDEAAASLGAASSGGRVLAVGDGAWRYRTVLLGVGGLEVAGETLRFPRPEVLGSLARLEMAEQGPPRVGTPVFPDYLRAPDVKVGWKARGER